MNQNCFWAMPLFSALFQHLSELILWRERGLKIWSLLVNVCIQKRRIFWWWWGQNCKWRFPLSSSIVWDFIFTLPEHPGGQTTDSAGEVSLSHITTVSKTVQQIPFLWYLCVKVKVYNLFCKRLWKIIFD